MDLHHEVRVGPIDRRNRYMPDSSPPKKTYFFGILGLLVGSLGLTGCFGASGDGEPGSFVLASLLITFLMSLAGGAIPLLFHLDSRQLMLETMTGISAGFLLTAAFIIVIPEGFERYLEETNAATTAHLQEEEATSESPAGPHLHHDHGIALDPALASGLAILLGFLVMFLAESLGYGHDIHEEHHDQKGGHVHHPVSESGGHLTLMVLIGLTIHSFADGMAIGASLIKGPYALTSSLIVSLLMHKVPAAFSLVIFSQHAHGGNRSKTWTYLLVFSASTPLAILLTWLTLSHSSIQAVGLALLFSAGTFVYVATIDVLPKVLQAPKRRSAAIHVFLGCAMLLTLVLLLQWVGFSLHSHG